MFLYLLIPNPKRPLASTPRLCLPSPWHRKYKTVAQKLSARMSIHLFICHFYNPLRERTSVGGKIQHLTISTMWDFIGALLLLLLLPCRHQGHEDTEEQRDWPPFTRVVKVDKLAADRRKKKAARQPRSHFPKCLLPIHSLRLLSLPAFGRTRPRVTLMHGAAVLQGPGKVCLHLGDFPIPESHRVAVKKKEKKKSGTSTTPSPVLSMYHPAFTVHKAHIMHN